MKQSIVLCGALWISLSSVVAAQSVHPDEAQTRPNIVLIVADDHARQAVSAYNSTLIHTPSIDRIAKEGLLFSNAFVTNAICGPSRAVMLTGKYSHRNGLRDNRDPFDGNQETFPKILQAAGYETMVVGKWHLRSVPHGFDFWSILPGQGEYYNPRFIRLGDTVRLTGYVTDLITDVAIEALRARDSSKPFCLLYHHKAPHRNWMPNIPHLELFNDRTFAAPENFVDDYAGRSRAAREQEMEVARHLFEGYDLKLPIEYVRASGGDTAIMPGWDAVGAWEATLRSLTERQREAWEKAYGPKNRAFIENPPRGKNLALWKYQRYIKDYLRCVVSLDENVGRLLDFLDSEGLSQNTVVVYTSDQGFFLGEHGWFDKRFMYEESLGIPLMVRYPAGIQAGARSDALVLNLDFAPTILQLAGAPIPEEIQGKSLVPLFEEHPGTPWRSSVYYHYYEYPHGWHAVKKHYGVRTDRYKLIHFYGDVDAWELYDLQRDPHEMVNLYEDAAHREIVDHLKRELQRLRVQLGDVEDYGGRLYINEDMMTRCKDFRMLARDTR